MKKIAIIDTAIDPDELHCSRFHFYNLTDQAPNPYTAKGQISHGTMIAKILDLYIEGYELVNIQILADSLGERGKLGGTTEQLLKALRLCIKLKVDLVSLSAVTTFLSENRTLYDCIKELAENSVVVAAMDNNGYMTIPGSYPFVIGVRADKNGYLRPGTMARVAKDFCGADIYANCRLEVVLKHHYSPLNSLAVPVVVAQIYKELDRGNSISEIIQRLPVIHRDVFLPKSCLREIKGPLILIHGRNYEKTIINSQKIMDDLFDNYGFQTSGLVTMCRNDIRLRKIKAPHRLKNEILLMEKHYKTDLIFVILSETEKAKKQIDFDIEIDMEYKRMRIVFENYQMIKTLDTAAEFIYHTLT